MPRPEDRIDSYRWPDGSEAVLQRDGTVRTYGCSEFGCIPKLRPEHRQGFTEAGAIRPIDPQDPSAGYIVYRLDGAEFRFDNGAKGLLQT